MKYFVAILFFAGYCFGQALSPEKVMENVQSKYSQMNDVSADFIQTVKMRYKQSGQTISGSIQLKKGDQYRIVTEQQSIVTDGKKVWMYSPASKQVIVDVFKQNRRQFSPDKFLTGLPKDFSISKLDTSSGFLKLSLQPSKDAALSSMMTDLTVWVKNGTWLVEKIEYSDKNKTTTAISLSNIRFNKGISDSLFRFEITTEMKVIDVNSFKQ